MVYLVMMPFLYSFGTRSHPTSTLVLFNTVTLFSKGAAEGPAKKRVIVTVDLISYSPFSTGCSTFPGKISLENLRLHQDNIIWQIIDIVKRIQNNKDKGMFYCGIFIDLKKAFDTVDHASYYSAS